MMFDQKMVNEIYQCITSNDERFAKQFAIAALHNAIEIHTDMVADADLKHAAAALPNDADVRIMSEQFTNDMLTDFTSRVKELIKEMRFTANIKAHVKMETELEIFE